MMPGASARRCGDGNGQRGGGECITCETKEPNLGEAANGAPSLGTERGMDGKRRDEAFAPALYRTQDSAITRVLAAGPSGWSVLALPSNTLLPSRHPAPPSTPPSSAALYLQYQRTSTIFLTLN